MYYAQPAVGPAGTRRPPPPSYAPPPPPSQQQLFSIPTVHAVAALPEDGVDVPAPQPSSPDSSSSRAPLPRTESTWSSFFSRGGVDPRCKTADINRIVEMGFSRDQAVAALMVNDFNLARAIDSLMH